MLTPRAASTSAAPLLEEAARLPCLATGTLQAAHTNATAVEIFERAGLVAAGAAHIDRVGQGGDAQHLLAHRGDGAGDLVDRLAAHPHRHQEAAHLRRRRLARHHDGERQLRLGAGQRAALRREPDEALEVGDGRCRHGRGQGALIAARASRRGCSRRRAGNWRAACGRARSRCSRDGTARRRAAASCAAGP